VHAVLMTIALWSAQPKFVPAASSVAGIVADARRYRGRRRRAREVVVD
jgi:hypothetical protein